MICIGAVPGGALGESFGVRRSRQSCRACGLRSRSSCFTAAPVPERAYARAKRVGDVVSLAAAQCGLLIARMGLAPRDSTWRLRRPRCHRSCIGRSLVGARRVLEFELSEADVTLRLFACYSTWFPCAGPEDPCYFSQGISPEVPDSPRQMINRFAQYGQIARNSLYLSQLAGNLRRRRFAADCFLRQPDLVF